ncbi:GlsB/YeaQ/YmgE family stress response membrane protein [Paracoccus sanguinis]|uniref:GlsB/YeaQ/YmgE family stress response membrane protein n=1 Tax=Paracoccus sanguinis TaxID=1545044 RepID=UPI00051FF0F0|nr:GlsB/YeaQ/YmgE family stress response membrane protein [Paracoccus sanguinis]KGJ13519.1 hypothetical protein IX55_16640 [Paracoccus sanguinis]
MRIASAVLLAAVLGLAACGPDPAALVAPATGHTVAGTNILGSIVFATIGAVILLLVLRLFNRN